MQQLQNEVRRSELIQPQLTQSESAQQNNNSIAGELFQELKNGANFARIFANQFKEMDKNGGSTYKSASISKSELKSFELLFKPGEFERELKWNRKVQFAAGALFTVGGGIGTGFVGAATLLNPEPVSKGGGIVATLFLAGMTADGVLMMSGANVDRMRNEQAKSKERVAAWRYFR